MFSFLSYIPLLILVWIPIALYYWALHRNSYWKRKNIPYIRGVPFLGNFADAVLMRKCTAEIFYDLYFHKKAQDQPFVGVNCFHKPALVLRDPEIIKRILVKDFGSFSNRHSSSDIHTDTLGSSNLFFAKNPGWRRIRSRLTPFFTSGKMKQMFYLMNEIGDELNNVMLKFDVNTKTQAFCTEIKDLCSRYTTDIISSCAFGVNANSLQKPDAEFRKHGKTIFNFTYRRAIEFSSIFFIPELVSVFRFKAFSKSSTNFLRESIGFVMDEREKNTIHRNDLIDTLIDLRKEDRHKEFSITEAVFQGDILVAQAAAFFTAGFETSSSVMSFTLYELALQPDIQDRLRQEIKDTLTKLNGKNLTYDVVQNMEYISLVISETLRMYPPLPFLDRECTVSENEKGYALDPFDDFIIPKGMPVYIPVYAMQRDPKYFPNPLKYDPERFSNENKKNVNQYAYMPFGTGPHNCIGERFGSLQSKIGLINFLKSHKVSPSERTPKTIKLDSKALIIQVEGGIHLNVIRDLLL